MWPSGHVVRLLGSAGELGPESEAVLVQCGVRWQPFCSGAIGELPQVRGACRCGGARAWRIWCFVKLQFGEALLISTSFCPLLVNRCVDQVADASEWRVPESERLYRRDLTGPDYFVCR